MTFKTKIALWSSVAVVVALSLTAIAIGGDVRTLHTDILELDNSGYHINVSAGSLSGNTAFSLPPNGGTANYVLRTDGSGVATWVSPLSTFSKSDASTNGYLSSTDWTTFNAKQATISVTAPVTLTGALIALPEAGTSADGYLSSTDWNTFNSDTHNPMTATGDIIYSSDNSGTPARLGIGAATTVLHGGTTPTYSGVATSDITGQVAIAQGGTGAATKSAGFDALQPMAALGDTVYGGTAGTGSALSGNTTSTKNFLTQTGTGAVSAAPAWGTIVAGDVPNLAASKITSGTLAVAQGGTNLASGTSGGVLAYTASGTLASSGVLTGNAVVIGGGASFVPGVVTNNSTATNEFLTQSSSGTPAWAALLAGDIPSLAASKITSGTLAVAQGGTNLASGTSGGILYYSAPGTLASSGALASNGVVYGGGAGTTPATATAGTADQVLVTPHAGGAPVMGQVDVSKSAAVTGALAIGNGGTGQVTANAAVNALLPSQTSNSGKVLSTNGTDTSWAAALTSTLNSAHLFVGNVSNVAMDVAVTGDVTISNAGVTAIGSGKVTSGMIVDGTIVDADINASAAIAGSKIATIAQSAAGVDSSAAQRLGTNTNDDASTGNIGEYDESLSNPAGTSVPNTGTWGDAFSHLFTAGDWDVTCISVFATNGATITTGDGVDVGISSHVGNDSTGLVLGSNWVEIVPPTANADSTATVPNLRIKVANGATTTYYCKMRLFYSVATPVFWGRFSWRRVR